MNRSDLTTAISERSGLTLAEANAALSATLDAIVDAVAAGDTVTLSGFGTFELRHRSARSGRNPQTGEPMEIPATRSPAFKSGKAFKRAVSKT